MCDAHNYMCVSMDDNMETLGTFSNEIGSLGQRLWEDHNHDSF